MANQPIMESVFTIRFSDCDPFNHLNNARYLDYFLNAREDHLLHQYGFNLYEYAMQTKESWVVSQNHIAYLAPALLNEKVVIQSQLIAYGKKNTTIEMQMWNKNKTQLKAVLWAKFIHFSLKTLAPIEHSEALKKIFGLGDDPQKETCSFDERVMQLKQKA